jgi:hypothetical protein
LKRAVYPDVTIQRLINDGALTKKITEKTLSALLDAQAIHPVLTQKDFNWLQQCGIFKASLTYEDGEIRVFPELRIPADLSESGNLNRIARHCLGRRLKGGIIMHGGFFFGPRNFYSKPIRCKKKWYEN